MISRQAAPLREQAAAAIRTKIIEGEFLPGQRLKERELCEIIGVSRTVVREVLRQLETEQLVVVEPQVGPIVVRLSAEDIRDLYEARAALEGATGRLASQNATDTQMLELEEKYRQIADSQELTMHELLLAKDDFYSKLVEISGNRVIGQMLDNIQARISQLRRLTLSSPGRHAVMVQELGEVVDRIRSRDELGAYLACAAHVHSAERIALSALEAQARASPSSQ